MYKKTILFTLSIFIILGAAPPPEQSQNGMVASDHVQASKAGASILEQGGNAVDAAIATALSAGVLQPAGSGLGGGGFAVYRTKAGSVSALDFRERAPAEASRDMFVEQSSRRGGRAVAVPGETSGLMTLHKRYGSLPLRKIAQPAIRQAEKGFAVGYQLHKSFQSLTDGTFVQRFLNRETAPKRGEVIQRKRTAAALKAFVRSNGKAMTHGWVAQDIVDSIQQSGGMITLEDMQNNIARDRPLIEGEYRGWKIWSMSPPSSGGLVLVQVLRALEAWDVASLGHNSDALLHLYAELFQHAFADRANYMGDPDRVSIPIEVLLSKERIQQMRASYSPYKTLSPDSYGSKVDIGQDEGTQHVSVIDRDGNSIALTTTINTIFGSQVVATKSGLVLNNEMDDFVARPGKPNAYGLIGSEANSVAPGAIPLSSMSPTILISPNGEKIVSIGASGGPFIISSTLQVIVNLIDFEMDPSTAVSVPRMHHQWQPQKLFLDKGIPIDIHRLLQAKGHQTQEFDFYSSVQVVTKEKNFFVGASDPRKGGWPAGAK